MAAARRAMEDRAKEYILDHGPAPVEDVIPAMTLTGDVRRARRILNDMIESGAVLCDEDGLLRLANPAIETLMLAARLPPEE